MRKMGKAYLIIVAIVFCLASGTAMATNSNEIQKPQTWISDLSYDLELAGRDSYIWRGQQVNNRSVLQPSASIYYGDFGGNLWANYEDSLDEIDLTLFWGTEVRESWWIEAGYVYYYYLHGVHDSQEFYISSGLDILLSPTLTINRDFRKYQHWYINLEASHEFKINEKASINLSASAGLLFSMDADEYPRINNGEATNSKFGGLHDGTLAMSMPLELPKDFTLTPSISYTFPLTGNAREEMKWWSLDGEDATFWSVGIVITKSF